MKQKIIEIILEKEDESELPQFQIVDKNIAVNQGIANDEIN